MKIKLEDGDGKSYAWSIRPSDYVQGWAFTDHEGYTRHNEGNWSALVFRFNKVADNYGMTLHSELS